MAKISRDICLNAQDGVKCLIVSSGSICSNSTLHEERNKNFTSTPQNAVFLRTSSMWTMYCDRIFTSKSPISSPLRHFFMPLSQLHIFSLIIHSVLPHSSGCRAAHLVMDNLQGRTPGDTWLSLPPMDPMPAASQLGLGPWDPSLSTQECWLAWSCEAGLMQATITPMSLRMSELFPSTAPWPLDLTVFEPSLP